MRKSLLAVSLLASGLSGVAHASGALVDDVWTQRSQVRTEMEFQAAGFDPVSAHWGAWAFFHQPSSQCAILDGFVKMNVEGKGLPGATDNRVMIVQDRLCTPAALKRSAQAHRPANDYEKAFIRQQWGVTWDKSQKAIKDEKQAEEDKKNGVVVPYLYPMKYPSSPCLAEKIHYPEIAEQESDEDAIKAECHILKKSDHMWHAENCSFVSSAEQGRETSAEVVAAFKESAKDYMQRVCWADENRPSFVDLNKGTSDGIVNINYQLGNLNN
ncbi:MULTISPECIES: hypothetical protein [unclassified Saccharibacter]|uniref:hypothetical protein n=1 Tax=unclassified Saccharibacter TaxID=2648722 RepID=UPI00132BCFF0|nr:MULTISPECIES: hypothetical protein [unclassified Saccharibacter]MXV35664.1 hypothetical protein [Saccharibacter sp. EH611]MXV58278.1 hypothetical protein [Saccharibacter sp. EH70]MXV66425.1 hypothetical protein [Saccharibacter sp. EH60]